MNDLLQDLRRGLRLLVREPSFTLVALLALALGIGANTAIFSVVDAVLLKPLPYPDSDRLVSVFQIDPRRNIQHGLFSYPKFEALADANQVFSSTGVYTYRTFNLTGAREPEVVQGAQVSEGFFRALGAAPKLGRAVLPEEDRHGANNVVVLSERLWRRRYNADPGIAGKSVEIDGQSATVVGVMPASLQFPDESIELWVPRVLENPVLTEAQMRKGAGFLGLIARLKPGVTLAQARAQINTISDRYGLQNPGNLDAYATLDLAPLLDDSVAGARTTLLILLGAVAMVLLIACANVANLLLVRASARQPEAAVRMALGAPRSRLVRQFLTESVLLALAGGVLGLLLAYWGVRLLVATSPANLPRISDVTVDARVLGYTLLVSILAGILFGLVPAFRATRVNLSEALKERTRGGTGGRGQNRLRSLLVIGEIAVALVLAVGAGLLIESFLRLTRVNPGFDANNVLTARVVLPPSRYSSRPQQAEFFRQVLEKVAALSGVESAAAVNYLPLGSGGIAYFFHVEGQPDLGAGKNPAALLEAVDPSYFRAMRIPLLTGRTFKDADNASATQVAIVDEQMARHFWPGEDPVGKHITYSRENWTVEIVGVVSSVKYSSLADPPQDMFYVPYSQQPWSKMTLVVRAASNPASLAGALRAQVLAVDKNQPVSDVRTLDEVVATSTTSARLAAWLLGLFALLAVTLATLGTYGVMSYTVAQRTHEIGIRMTLGAEPRAVERLMLSHALRLTLAGVAVGVAGGLMLTGILTSLLFGVQAKDPALFVLSATLLAASALVASHIAARRATRVDPVLSLRHE